MSEELIITKNKKKELEEELEIIQSVKRKEIIDAVQTARAMGDLSENAEYKESRAAQSKNEARIRYIERVLKDAQVVEGGGSESVEIGSKVLVQKKGDSTERNFEMVGADEADMTRGMISYESPIGQALMGKKKDEEASFETPAGKITYKILNVE